MTKPTTSGTSLTETAKSKPKASREPTAYGTSSIETDKSQPKAVQNRAMLEVMDNFFNLDSIYLLKELSGGNLKRCSKSCKLKEDCLPINSDIDLQQKTVQLSQQNDQKETDSEQQLSAFEETASLDLNNFANIGHKLN